MEGGGEGVAGAGGGLEADAFGADEGGSLFGGA